MKKLLIDIWSDIACPWCYIGKRRLESALASFAHRDDVEVTWHAFELDPKAPREHDATVSPAQRLAKKYGMSTAQAEDAIANVTSVAAKDGLEFHLDTARSGNTFDAHRVVRLAHERGIQDAVKERLLRGYQTERECVGDPETLVRLGVEAGLDETEVREVLAGQKYANEVRADEAQAAELGISGVPFFVIGGRYGVSGAQPANVLQAALEKAWAEATASIEVATEGAQCGPDGCA